MLRRPGLLQYVTGTTLPHIQDAIGMPEMPLPGHKSGKNHLRVKSEAWRRLENIYQIDPSGFAQQVVGWTLYNIRDMPFKHEDSRSGEKLSLGTRRKDGLSDKLNRPMDTIDCLADFLDSLPLKSAQRLFHILFPNTHQWKFRRHEDYDIDKNIFNYFLWTRTQHGAQKPQNTLLLAYQPPWVLGQADFEDFVKCGSLPPHVPPGNLYPSELQGKHRIWAKLWDTCVKHNTKWFVITSWNVWAFGCFSDGWCSGIVSDIWHLDEHTPNVLECLTFWMASAMEREGVFRKPKVPEPLNALRAEIMLPAPQAEIATPSTSESNWQGKSQDPPTSAHLVSFSTPLSHHGVEDYAAPPVERETPRRDEFILEWRNSITGTQEAADGAHGWDTVFNRRLPMVNLHGEWLI